MHVRVFLALVTFLDVVFRVLLHGRPIIACLQRLSCQGSSAHVLGVDSLIDFLQYLGDYGFFDTF